MSRRSTMSSSGGMSSDIHDSIFQVLGKHVKILLKVPVKLELKGGDKTENRILVFTAHRLFVFTAKVPTRIADHFHYLDFKSVESCRPTQLVLQMHGSDKAHAFRPQSPSGDVDEMLVTLVAAVRRIFPGVGVDHVLGRVHVQPAERLRDHLAWKPPDPKLVGPCGGFSAQYACLCDYYGLPFREEVAWDVDTIYFSHDSHEMGLQDFEHLDHRDLLCIISALEHNTWFTKLKASGNSVKLSADLCDRILQVVAKSVSLQELHVSGIGARWEFAARLAQAMSQNQRCVLASFDLSCNFLEDKGVNQLSQVVGKMQKGLHHVNLSHCSLTQKGLTNFSNALAANRLTANTLTYLNLSGNTMKDESHALCTFLAQPNAVAILDISGTETPLDVLFGALVRGCTTALTHLNLSRNTFSSKKAKEIPGAFKQYFANTLVLQYLNLSHCKLPAEAVKHLLLGLACNEATANVELNLSNNNLSANGATVLESCIGGVKCITRLDLSENGIEAEMAGVMLGIARNKSIISLNVSRNMTTVKPKYLPNVMESIVQLIQDEETIVQKLNLSDCKLKAEINNVINALGSNQCLQHLDISGNLMGDVGARLLAKALQINTRLRIVNLDRNAISLQGYTDVTYALQSNYAMRHIPFPTYDMQPFIKTHPDRVDAMVHRMQELLQRNSSPNRFRNTAQAFRLTQGFLLSSTQQSLDRVSAATQNNVDTLRKIKPELADTSEDVRSAEGLVQDAENSKHLLSALHEVTARGPEVDKKLRDVSHDLSTFVESHVKQNLDAMLACAERQCPRVMKSASAAGGPSTKLELLGAGQKKCQISPDFVTSLIMDQLGLEVHNKINELNLIIANHISDRVIDEVIEGMRATSKNLVTEIGTMRKKRSLTPDLHKVRSLSVSESLENQETGSLGSGGGGGGGTPAGAGGSVGGFGGDGASQKSESSPLGTPQTNKRKSIQGRKLRPKSVVDGGDAEDEDAASTSSPDRWSHLKKTTPTPIKNGLPEEDTVPDLPSSSVLQHLGKARPKRPKRHAPSRGAVIHQQGSSGNDADEDAMSKFYTSPSSANNASFSPGSTPSGSPMLEDFPPRGGSVSSNRSNHSSREDLVDGATPTSSHTVEKKQTSLFGSKSKTMTPDMERSKSPLSFLGSKEAKTSSSSLFASSASATPPSESKSKLGFSCLTSAVLDEDTSALAAPAGAKASPEKRALSPSLHSITDIFSSKSSSSSKLAAKAAAADNAKAQALSPGISPFAARKQDSDLSKRLSFNPADAGGGDMVSPADPDAGKRTPEGVVKRHGIGHGGNPDLMAEIKEKRASMVPKMPAGTTENSDAHAAGTADDAAAEGSAKGAGNVFGQVKLRSTGRAGNLTSPTTEFPPTTISSTSSSSTTATTSTSSSTATATATTTVTAATSSTPATSVDKLEASSSRGSIVGLRSSKFGGVAAATTTSPEPKPRATATTNSSSSPSESASSSTTTPPFGSKPKPLPKPRPWSIVGVDRKSGEVTSVCGGGGDSPVSPLVTGSSKTEEPVASASASNSLERASLLAGGPAPATRKSSVRDLINNMNKVGGDAPSGGGAGATATATATAGADGGLRRKGNSLPRGAVPPSSSETAATTTPASRANKFANSPMASKKSESTNDDPRILKLDDDFAFEDMMDV